MDRVLVKILNFGVDSFNFEDAVEYAASNSGQIVTINPEMISYASFMIDLVLQVVRQNNDSSIFDVVSGALVKLEEGLDPVSLTNILQLKLLDYLGVSPCLDACSSCGSDKNIVTISSDVGGYVCKNCYNNEGLVSEKTIKMQGSGGGDYHVILVLAEYYMALVCHMFFV